MTQSPDALYALTDDERLNRLETLLTDSTVCIWHSNHAPRGKAIRALVSTSVTPVTENNDPVDILQGREYYCRYLRGVLANRFCESGVEETTR